MLSILFVDIDEFNLFMKFVEPNYKVPCHQTMTTQLDALKDAKHAELMIKSITRGAVVIAVTSDTVDPEIVAAKNVCEFKGTANLCVTNVCDLLNALIFYFCYTVY
jgi:hypothetical protein